MTKKPKAKKPRPVKFKPADVAVLPAVTPGPTTPVPHGFCGTCYFATPSLGALICSANSPAWQRTNNPATGLIINWPTVTATDWCGHGCDATTGQWYTPDGTKPTA